MKRKLVIVLMAIIATLCCVFGLTACGDDSESGGKNEHIHKLAYIEAKEANCFTDGNTFYYTCLDCGKWFADSDGHTEITDKSSVVVVKRHNNVWLVEEEAADCYKDGHSAYYHCSDCDKWFKDENCNTEITDKSSVVVAKGHNLSFVEAKSPTCTDRGNIAYYNCNRCGQCFTDEKCENTVYIDDTMLLAKHSNLTFVEGSEPTCTTDGIISHYICGVCGKYRIDEMGEIDESHLVIPKIRHEINIVNENAATCTSDGNIMYYSCVKCDNWFYDINCEELITDKSSVVLPKKHIYLQHFERVDNTCINDGNIEYYICITCNKWFTEEQCENEIADMASVILEKTGHSYEGKKCGKCGKLKPTDGLEYDISVYYNYCTVIGIGTAIDNDIVIPEEYDGIEVKQIGWNAFKDCKDITSVTIPDSITGIGDEAFAGCSGLKSIEIPCNVTSVASDAFKNCTNLLRITVSNDNKCLYSQGNCLIQYYQKILICGFNNSVIPDDVEIIGTNAFSGCLDMSCINIPDGVTVISDKAFYGCSSLANIRLPKTLKSIGNEAFANCSSLTAIMIPNSVTGVGDNAFENCELISATLPAIAISCIPKTKLETVTVLNSEYNISNYVPNYIPDNAFKDCISLTSVIIQEGVESIGDHAFYGCIGIENIIIPDSVLSISWLAFAGCSSLKDVTIGKGVESIDYMAFENCISLTTLTLPVNVTFLGHSITNRNIMVIYCEAASKPERWDNNWNNNSPVVWNCKNNEIAEDGYIYSIIDGIRYALKGETATVTWQARQASGEIVIPNAVNYKNKTYNVTTIEKSAFSFCANLTGIELPNGVTDIGVHAFEYCINLTRVKIPNSVTFIGERAFRSCSKLMSAIIPDSVISIGERIFEECSNIVINCVSTSKADGWDNYWYGGCPVVWDCENNEIAEDGHLYIIIDGIRYYFINGTIEVAKQATWIAGDIIIRETVDFKDNTYSVTSICDGAFSGCCYIGNIFIPNSVTSIGIDAFRNCNVLTSIVVDENNENYSSQDGILYNKDKTEFIYVPTAIKGEIIIASGIKTINREFFNCRELTSIVLPDSLISIGSAAFYECESLISVTIPLSITSLLRDTFGNCVNLTDINYDGTKEQWEEITKDTNWDYNTGNYTIHCTDGDISK